MPGGKPPNQPAGLPSKASTRLLGTHRPLGLPLQDPQPTVACTVNKAQGALPLGRRALSLPLPAHRGPHLMAYHLARPPGREKAQGALPLGRRALSHPHVSLTAGHTSCGLPPCVLIGSEENPDPLAAMRGPWAPRSPCTFRGALFGQRCPPWLHVHQRCLDRDPSSRQFRSRPCQGGAGHRRLRVLQGESQGSVCP